MNSYIEISAKDLIDNIKQIRSFLPAATSYVAVVKGNAYGLGLKEVVRGIDSVVDGYHIVNLQELQILRSESKKLSLLLGYVSQEELATAMELRCTLSLFSFEQISIFEKTAKQLGIIQPVHIKIDALVGRFGFFINQVDEVIDRLAETPHIEVTGVYSHLTGLKDSINWEHTKLQCSLFKECVTNIKKRIHEPLAVHISSSAGAFIPEVAHDKDFNMIRVGKAMYGIWPSKELPETAKLNIPLKWKTQIAQIKNFPADYPIGYHATTKTSENILAAVIPQGYSDGLDKKFSSEGAVLIHGQYCKIIGKISMCAFLVDIGQLKEVKVGDEVVLLGTQFASTILPADIGNKIGATSCEVLARLSPTLPRVLLS